VIPQDFPSRNPGEKGILAGKLRSPSGVAVNAEGDIWVADTANDRIEEWSPEGKYLAKIGAFGTEPGKLDEPTGIAIDAKGNIWVADTANNRIEEFKPEGTYVGEITATCTEGGKLKAPAALTFDAKGNLWVADTGNDRIEKFNTTEEKCISQFGSAGSEPGKLAEPKGIASHTEDGEEHVWVADTGNNRLQEFSTTGSLQGRFGTTGTGEGEFDAPEGIAFDSSGDLWVTDGLNGRVQSFLPCLATKPACSSASSEMFSSQVGWKGTAGGQLNEPMAVAFDAHGNLWVSDSANNRVAEWSPGANAHDAKVIYYTAEENKEHEKCGKHAEWAELVCMTLPAKQPELDGLPKLPETTVVAYNIWDEPTETEEKFGSTPVRVKKESYYEDGQPKTSETTATGSSDKTLPPVTFEYNKEAGALEKESTSEGTITTEANRLGQPIKYTDAKGNTATFKYAGPEKDDLIEETTDGHEELHEGKERKSYQRYYYEETTKRMNKLEDSAAGTFTAEYDAEGNMTTEIDPNGMCADYTYNTIGEATALKYLKTTSCSETEGAAWYSDSRVPGIHGQMLSQTSTLASETYSYDPAERLSETQETPAGEGCSTRAYTYDEESNRASLTTRKPGSKGECETEGGTTEAHNYDEANRLTDAEIAYEPFGNVEKLPAADAEGHALTTTYYVDNAVAEQTQNSVTHKYHLDPDGRVAETITGAKTLISHYDAPGEGVAWTSEEEGKTTTREIPGIDGTLTAVQTNNETPVLQLHDLEGDTVATIGDSTSETKLLSTYNSTEF
jgi:sugar lactone lactonase YvrE